jgi:hypothetical protein
MAQWDQFSQKNLQANVAHDGRNGQSQATATQAASRRLPPVQAPQAVIGEEGRAQTGATRRDAARDACCARRAVFVGFSQPLIVGHLPPRYVRVSLGARTHMGFAHVRLSPKADSSGQSSASYVLGSMKRQPCAGAVETTPRLHPSSTGRDLSGRCRRVDCVREVFRPPVALMAPDKCSWTGVLDAR